jgi:hypothetical protein
VDECSESQSALSSQHWDSGRWKQGTELENRNLKLACRVRAWRDFRFSNSRDTGVFFAAVALRCLFVNDPRTFKSGPRYPHLAGKHLHQHGRHGFCVLCVGSSDTNHTSPKRGDPFTTAIPPDRIDSGAGHRGAVHLLYDVYVMQQVCHAARYPLKALEHSAALAATKLRLSASSVPLKL